MDEPQADRDGLAENDNNELQEAAELSGRLWTWIQEEFSPQRAAKGAESGPESVPKKAPEPAAQKAAESGAESGIKSAAGSDSKPGSNQWRESGRKNELNIESRLNVSFEQLQKYNPELNKAELARLPAGAMLKMRHASTGEIDSGWSLEALKPDGSLEISKTYKLNALSNSELNPLLLKQAGVPDSHLKALNKKLEELPENVLKALTDAGYKIVASRKITEAIPELEGKTPRGWPSDSSFDNSDGTHDNLRRLIIAPLIYDQGKNDWAPVHRPEVLVHQIGHALDHALGKLSNDPEFQKAFKHDLERLGKKSWLMSDREKAIYDYFSQKDGPEKGERPGSEECFASLFGLILTGPENPQDKKPFVENFPNTIAVVKEQIAKLGRK